VTRIAIQGEPGSYSHAAAIRLVGEDVDIVPNRSFEDAFAAVGEDRAEVAVVPVENSLAGAVVESLDLLPGCGLSAVAETHVGIELSLVARPGTSVSELTVVASHPVALRQCRRFFRAHPHVESRAAFDTAGSIRRLVDAETDYDAAIGPALAARIYGGEVLLDNLEDDPLNFTRFLELRPRPKASGRRAIVSVIAENRPGGLLDVLTPIAEEGVDLTQLVTRPIPGEPWHYRFHLELRGPAEDALERALPGLEAAVDDYRLMGLYDLKE